MKIKTPLEPMSISLCNYLKLLWTSLGFCKKNWTPWISIQFPWGIPLKHQRISFTNFHKLWIFFIWIFERMKKMFLKRCVIPLNTENWWNWKRYENTRKTRGNKYNYLCYKDDFDSFYNFLQFVWFTLKLAKKIYTINLKGYSLVYFDSYHYDSPIIRDLHILQIFQL